MWELRSPGVPILFPLCYRGPGFINTFYISALEAFLTTTNSFLQEHWARWSLKRTRYEHLGAEKLPQWLLRWEGSSSWNKRVSVGDVLHHGCGITPLLSSRSSEQTECWRGLMALTQASLASTTIYSPLNQTWSNTVIRGSSVLIHPPEHLGHLAEVRYPPEFSLHLDFLWGQKDSVCPANILKVHLLILSP